MNDLKATSVLQKLYIDSARKGQVSLVSTHDVTSALLQLVSGLFWFQSVDYIHKQVMKSKTISYTKVSSFIKYSKTNRMYTKYIDGKS